MEVERHAHQLVASHTAPVRAGETYCPGTFPWPESNPRSFRSRTDAPALEPKRPGLHLIFKGYLSLFHSFLPSSQSYSVWLVVRGHSASACVVWITSWFTTCCQPLAHGELRSSGALASCHGASQKGALLITASLLILSSKSDNTEINCS